MTRRKIQVKFISAEVSNKGENFSFSQLTNRFVKSEKMLELFIFITLKAALK